MDVVHDSRSSTASATSPILLFEWSRRLLWGPPKWPQLDVGIAGKSRCRSPRPAAGTSARELPSLEGIGRRPERSQGVERTSLGVGSARRPNGTEATATGR